MNRLRLMYLRWREAILEAQVANGEALMADHAERLKIARAELEEVEQKALVIRLSGNPQSLLAQAIRRHG